MLIKGLPGMVITDGERKIELNYKGEAQVSGNTAKWIQGLVKKGKLKGIEIVKQQEEPEKAEETKQEEAKSDKA